MLFYNITSCETAFNKTLQIEWHIHAHLSTGNNLAHVNQDQQEFSTGLDFVRGLSVHQNLLITFDTCSALHSQISNFNDCLITLLYHFILFKIILPRLVPVVKTKIVAQSTKFFNF